MADTLTREVLQQAMEGNVQAFRKIVQSCQSGAYSLAYRMVGNAQDAEDIVQDAFVRLWKHLPSYRFEVKITTWLYKIVTNLCLDFLKSAKTKSRHLHTEINEITGGSINFTDSEMINEELQHWVFKAADELTPKQKAVFVLRDLEGLTVDEVSNILSMTDGNIKSNLYYARKHVCASLKRVYQVNEKLNDL